MITNYKYNKKNRDLPTGNFFFANSPPVSK